MDRAIRQRRDEDYEIESLTKGLTVLEALEDSAELPASIKRLEERTGFSRNFIMRTLRTFRLKGYVFQTPEGTWVIGSRITRFARNSAI